jgi:hypothetical protein
MRDEFRRHRAVWELATPIEVVLMLLERAMER